MLLVVFSAANAGECMMCTEAAAVVLFQPCGHQIVCHECSVRMKKCFLCHQPISNKLDRRVTGMRGLITFRGGKGAVGALHN